MQVDQFLFILSCLLVLKPIKSSQSSEYRLNKDIIPKQYDIYIKPYLHSDDGDKQFTFDGEVNITVQAIFSQIQKITLHKKYIDIRNAYLLDMSENSVQRIDSEFIFYDIKTDKLEITLTKALVAGKNYILNFNYHGQIRNVTEGFYRATNDNVRWYGLTQLHRIHARTVFPCFDEPEFKAKFRLHISRTHDHRSFFNTRLMKSTNEGERIIDHFEETPRMCTYLVAFVVGDFISQGSRDLQIIMDKKYMNKTNFAFETAEKVLQIYNNYTQIPYKSLGNSIMQMVGTDYFPHTGMENWGLVLYKEIILAQEPGFTDGLSNQELTVSLLFHEIAHMWFGNSVTHKWWSCFWLNEAFPTYYEYFLANEFYPEYEFDKQFIVKHLHFIFDLDASNKTQPLTSLEEDVNTPAEIGAKFSDIAYAKGAAVLRMFKNLMGKENFDKAIGAYLKEKHLSTAIPENLFKHFKIYWPSSAHNVDFGEFFKDWTEQVGYPVVNVSLSASGFFQIKQQRFLLDASDGSDVSLKYTIPITFSSDRLKNFRNFTPIFYLKKHENERILANASQHKWIVVNNQQSNYYRVLYDSDVLVKLKSALAVKNYSGIHVVNRAAIINDLFAFARTGLKSYDEVLDFMEYLKSEVEYLPWQAAFKGFQIISQHLSSAQQYIFAKYMFALLDIQFENIEFESSDKKLLDMYHRNSVISWLCKYDHQKCNKQARLSFQKHFEDNTQPSSDLRETLYCAAVRNDYSFIYKTLKNMFLKQQLVSEKERLLRSMACTKHFVQDYFEFLLTKNVSQALKQVGLESLYKQTPANIVPVFDLIIANTRKIRKTVQDMSVIGEIIKNMAQYFTSPEQLLLLKQFITEKGHLFGPSITNLEKSVGIVENNLNWSAKYLPQLMNYLIKHTTNYRLPTNVMPRLYDIHLKPYLRPEDGEKQFTVDGEVNITVQVNSKNVKEIRLHIDLIRILKAVLYDAEGNIVEIFRNESMFEEPLTNTVTIILLMPLQTNCTYVLHFKYCGHINDKLSGVFKGTYDNENWYGVTQLQRINARSVFPCFDEPQFKAKFRMHISRPESYNSVFNTRLLKTTIDEPDYYIDHFEETPLMSTYLIAFLISDFDIQGKDDFKIILHPKFKNKTNFAYKVGLRTLKAFDNFTQMPYKTLGNPIMQMAGTANFPYNGMENWGLILFKDSILVHEPSFKHGWANKEQTIISMAHEISHMWFGNSVTFKWWSHFWLNEAFARYYEYFVANQLYPEFELDKQFVVKKMHNIMETDCTINSQPLTSPEDIINTPSEIASKFSGITYSKGAAIVRMFANLMGREKFQQAIRDYLKENHLKNVEPQDFFKHLKKYWPSEHQVDLDTFFRDWTEQEGYPMVTVSRNVYGGFSLRQKRFLINHTDGSDSTLRYTIPLTYNSNTKNDYKNFNPVFYFNKTLEEVEIGKEGTHENWIVLNTQQSNYYRVFYNSHLQMKLLSAFKQPNHSGIHETNRASVIDDLFALARVGLKGYDELFKFLSYLATETEYIPWKAAFKGFRVLTKHFTLEQHKEFGDFLSDILNNVYRKLGFQNSNDTVLDVYNRNNVISWLCRYHHEDCNTQALLMFRAHMANHTTPLTDFRETLYCAACRSNDLDIYNSLRKLFVNEEISSERKKILQGMGCTRHNVITHYQFVLSKSVSQNLKATGLKSLYAQTPENVMTVYKLMIDNVKELKESLQDWDSTASALSDITEYLSTPEQLKMLKQFTKQKGYLFGTSVVILVESIQTLEAKLKWADKHLPKLSTYISMRNDANSITGGLLTISLLFFFV